MGISRAPLVGDRVVIVNNQRPGGFAEITTGPLRLLIRKGEGGFVDRVFVDADRNGFDDADLVAPSSPKVAVRLWTSWMMPGSTPPRRT